MDIPKWLQHVRRDRRGICVPWINRWVAPGAGGEMVPERVRIRHDRWVGGPGLFEVERPGDVPDFTRQDMGRQRESTIEGRCQVCARPVPWSRRFLVVADIATQVVDIDGVGEALVLTEPWLDRVCAPFAIEHCPALIRRHRDEHLSLLAVTSQDQVGLTVSRGWVEGPLEAESKRVQPAMWAKVIVGRPDRLVVAQG
jgi:hypothetical protein